jgi:hypothetical protein
MKQFFFSKPYIDAHIEQIKALLDAQVDSYQASPQTGFLEDTYLVTDSTYINDQCPSIQILLMGTTYLLYLPNSFVDNVHQEQYNVYLLMLDEDYGTGKDVVVFHDLESAINHLVLNKHYA